MAKRPTKQTLPESWVVYVTPFAETLGKTVEEVTDGLVSIVGEPGEQAIELLKDVSMSPDVDISAKLPDDVPSAVMRKAISQLRGAPAMTAEAAAAFTSPVMDVLPEVPGDGSWLDSLKAGGSLKVDESSVISAVRAGLARRTGLYEIPKRIVDAMEAHTNETLEQVDERYFALRKELTRVNYGEIFSAVPGLDKSYVTGARKDKLFDRLDAHFWPAITNFHVQLKGWVEAWQQGAANPGIMMGAMAQMMAGGGAGGMPPGMMQPPETGALRDGGESVNDEINRVFAGTGVAIAGALAYEANQIKKSMQDSSLPTLIGVANRDQMLRKLGVDVSANYARLETNLTKYVMGVLNIPNVAAGNEETTYFGSLFMLGSQINWDDLGAASRSASRNQGRVSSD